MTDFNINVVVNPSGAERGIKKVRGELKKTEDGADRLRKTIARAFTFGAIAFGVRQLAQLADTYTNIQNRLKVVTDTTEELTTVTTRLFDISNSTRQSFEATSTIYARTASAVKELGISQDRTLKFTKSLNQAVALSGATGAEAAAGLIQLSQGLASGTLRGDELRSVLEQLPVVADVIAKSLGVTRGELRQLGTDGKINAQIIIDAFAKAETELEHRFSELAPTIGAAFEVLKNNLVGIIGDFDTATGLSASFANIILVVGQNIETFARLAISAGIALSVNFAKKGVLVAASAVRTLTLAIAANPIGAIVTGLTVGTSLLIAFSDQLTISEGSLTSLADVAESSIGFIVRSFESLGEIINGAFISVAALSGEAFTAMGANGRDGFNLLSASALESFNDIDFSILGILKAGALVTDRLIGLFLGWFNSIVEIFKRLPDVIAEIFIDMVNGVDRIITASINAMLDGINPLLSLVGLGEIPQSELSQMVNNYRGAGENLGEAMTNGYLAAFNFNGVRGALDSVIQGADQIALERESNKPAASVENNLSTVSTQNAPAAVENKSLNPTFAALLKELNEDYKIQAKMLGKTNAEREIANGLLQIEFDIKRELEPTERERAKSLLEGIQSLEAQAEIYDFLKGPQQEYMETLGAINQLLKDNKISQIEANIALQDTQLSRALTDVQGSLNPEEEETRRLTEQLQERHLIVQHSIEAGLIQKEEGFLLSLELEKKHAQDVEAIQRQQASFALNSAQGTFESLAGITEGFAGKQSGAYKVLFGISKAFAIADATIQIQGAIAKAFNAPNIAVGIAQAAIVAAQTAKIISTIQGTQFEGGFASGGNFMVGGSGGTDSQSVSFMATPGERVSIETPQQQKANSNTESTNEEAGGVRILNVVDPSLVEDFMTSATGEKTLINTIQRNANSVNAALS